MKRVSFIFVGMLLSLALILTESSALIYGTLYDPILEEKPATGTVTYVATSNDFESILTEDGINPDAGTGQGYQGGYWRLEARNLYPQPEAGKTNITIEFAGIGAESGKFGSDSFVYSNPNENRGEIDFALSTNPEIPTPPLGQVLSPGRVRLTWTNVSETTYDVYRSTQASGADNGASNGRYERIATNVISPYIDEDVPIGAGEFVWYLIIAISDGKRSGHSPETVVVSDKLYGDVSGNNTVTGYDGALILQHLVGIIQLEPHQIEVADVSDDGEVTAYDASLIIQYVVGIIDQFPVEGGPIPAIARLTNNNDILLGFPHIIVKPGEPVVLPINVNQGGGITAAEFTLEYESNKLVPTKVTKTLLTDNYQLAYNIQGSLIKIALASAKPIPIEGGTLVNIHFKPIGKQSQDLSSLLSLSQIWVNETQLNRVIQGSIEILPNQFNLFQNYPNPFNPETWIPYQLSKEAEVTIKIFNIQAQLVRTINLGKKPAGSYLTKEKSAYWNGRNQAGEKVATGLYYYTIQTDHFIATKRMILLK